ncbi:MAG: response regulator, partial [Aestuariibacter sp.]|nr:response regulator [Aestuariibacter sp.]
MFRILIVDDEVINRAMLVQMLNDTGYVHCVEAEDGEKALALAEQ